MNGLKTEEAQKNFWVCDQYGLMHRSRGEGLNKMQTFFARHIDDSEYTDKMSLLDVVKKVGHSLCMYVSSPRSN